MISAADSFHVGADHWEIPSVLDTHGEDIQ